MNAVGNVLLCVALLNLGITEAVQMPMKTQKCCCCPDCTTNPGKCCQCICTTICVTIDPPGSGTENAVSVELDWDSSNKWFTGSITVDNTTIDLLFYFERDETGTDAGCYFVLESARLNFGEGSGSGTAGIGTGSGTDVQRQRWLVGTEIQCEDLAASVGTDFGPLTVECVEKVTPTRCNTCRCLCRCVCVTVTTEDYICTGKACWEESQQAYVGTLDCISSTGSGTGEFQLPIVIEIGPEVGTGTGSGSGTGTGSNQECYLRVEVDGKYAETLLLNCEERNLDYTLDLYDDPSSGTGTGTSSLGTVSITCAICNEICEEGRVCKICEDVTLPRNLTVSMYLCATMELVTSWTIRNNPPDVDAEEDWSGTAPDPYGQHHTAGGVSLGAQFVCTRPEEPTATWNFIITFDFGSGQQQCTVSNFDYDILCDPLEVAAPNGCQIFGPDTDPYCFILSL